MCNSKMHAIFALIVLLVSTSLGYKNPNYEENRRTMVHLFEWKFADIADECERFLGPMGYAAVQVSPVQENLIISKRPWYERYQTMSYKIETRSGNERLFKQMIPAIGTGGSTALTTDKEYPAVPYSKVHFHKTCALKDYSNATEVRECELLSLHDLDQRQEYVRQKMVNFLNSLIDAGVAGFRIDAAKHMYPEDLEIIYGRLKDLIPGQGFPKKSRPFVYQEVIDLGGESVKKSDYNKTATVVEFLFGRILGDAFRGIRQLRELETWGDSLWGLLPSRDAVVMIDNHDNQRGHGAGGSSILTYKTPKQYKMAVAFMLAHPYGFARVMSSFDFNDTNAGPPNDSQENILSPIINTGGTCTNGWVCEHRWPQIYNMVAFRNVVADAAITNWWTNDDDQVAFSRGNKGFVAFNNGNTALRRWLTTGLSAGRYCDVISGMLSGGRCTGKTIDVNENSLALIEILPNDLDGVVAIHGKAKL
ncbi:alpha-amylase A isoform X2 [Cephus cinctus]|uniref:alpha-amylase n=1 Tax=Cephus cinctus TaxID=211228 RepID=A0AAJ7C9K6_CEPCN|nr:alpha-amylase A isoform X2 [Cephus cinctus]